MDHVEEYRQAGIDGFVHVRVECLSFLRELNQYLGIAHK